MKRAFAALAAAAACALACAAAAQSYPAKPVKILVGFAAGGPTDVIARLVAQDMTGSLGQSFVVENRPGANAIIAAEAVARSAPDGDTLLFASLLLRVNAILMEGKVHYDPFKDFAPVSNAAVLPMVVVTSPETRINSMQELIVLARAKPGELSYATSGNGGSTHLAGAMLENFSGTKMINVPFKGNGPALARGSARACRQPPRRRHAQVARQARDAGADERSRRRHRRRHARRIRRVPEKGLRALGAGHQDLRSKGRMSAASGLRNAAEEVSAPAVSSCPKSRRASARVLRAWNIEDLRRIAKKRLPRAIFDFFDGAAEDETTLADNRAAFERVRIAPKMLAGVEKIDTSAAILGAHSRLPIAVGPTGGIGFGWPFADVGVARAAAAAGIPYTLSTMATASIERIAREAGGRLWFQAYVFKKREITLQLIERARQLGYDALMVTVDVPVGGKRERDFRNDYTIPFRFSRKNVLDFASRPGWWLAALRHGMPVLENVASFAPEATSISEIASSVGRFWDADFNWDGLKEIRDRWPRKMLVKRILRADNAARPAAMGAHAAVLSNHGGR